MQLRRVGLLLISATALAAPVHALDFEEQDASYAYRRFTDSEDVHVSSHYGRYNLTLAGGGQGFFQFNHETVTVPAITAPAGTPEAVDAITSASRPISNQNDPYRDYAKVRNEFQGDFGTRQVQAGYYLSTESDYFAQQVRARVNRDFFDENFTLSVGTSYGWDAIEPLQDDDTSTGNDTRTTMSWNAAATQTLSPTLLVRAGGELNLVHGLQHNPYRNVYAGGGHVPERHPDERMRGSVFLKAGKYLKNRSSLKAEYVAYRDDWGITAHTLTTQLHQYVTERVLVSYQYRYHTQTAASFYRDEYADPNGVDGYRTGDYRLEATNAHLFGVRLDLNLAAISDGWRTLRNLEFRIEYERYFNSNNFSANILESGLVYAF